MPLPAAARLVEFGPLMRGERMQGPGVGTEVLFEPRPTEEEIVAAAFARGKAEGIEEARIEYSATAAAERERFEARVAEERQAWTVEQGDRLAGCLAAASGQLSENIADAVSGILSVFVDNAARTACLDELQCAIERILSDGSQPTLRISGPDDLLAALRARLGPSAASLTFEVSQRPDVRVVADRTVIETQLEAWRERLMREIA